MLRLSQPSTVADSLATDSTEMLHALVAGTN
jgi:hypothetical protein